MVKLQKAESILGVFKAYKVTNNINNKLYIGVTRQPIHVRWSQHKSAALRGRKQTLHAAMRKHGIHNFQIEQIASAFDHDAMLELEVVLINQSGSYKTGYNSHPGGVSVTQESALKGAEHFRGKPRPPHVRQRLSELAKGRRHGPDAKAKMSAYRKGRPKTAEWKAAARAAWEKRRSGPRGVSPAKGGKWQAFGYQNGKSIYLGYYVDIDCAIAVVAEFYRRIECDL